MLMVMATSLMVERRPAEVSQAGAEVFGSRYELLDRVGRGGMSVVWRARDTVTDRLVAVKVLDERYAADRTLRQRIREEARIAATVSSPYVVRAFRHGDHQRGDERLPFVVMELVDGITLQERLNAGPMPPALAVGVGAQVAAGLAAIHAAGVVHCDVKPSNIMLVGDTAKIVDFGIAVRAGSGDALNRPFQILGTPAYMAPERLTGGVVRAPADVYALGILLYRLLAGASPWSVEDTMRMLVAHVSDEPAPLPPRAGIPASVAALADRCLAKDPAARPSAAEAELVLSLGSLTGAEVDGSAAEFEGTGCSRARWADRDTDMLRSMRLFTAAPSSL